jgi:hypothetical protein
MNITINAIELASELAEKELNDNWTDSIIIYEECEDGSNYTEEAQEIFNDLYDKYLSWIKRLEIKPNINKNIPLIDGLYDYFGG